MNVALTVLVVLVLWTLAGFAVALLWGQLVRRGDRSPAPSFPVRPAMKPVERALDELPAELAVTLHGMANSSVVVLGGLETLRTSWSMIDEHQRSDLLAVLHAQVEMSNRLLDDLLRGASEQMLHALDQVTTAQLSSAERILASELERRAAARP